MKNIIAFILAFFEKPRVVSAEERKNSKLYDDGVWQRSERIRIALFDEKYFLFSEKTGRKLYRNDENYEIDKKEQSMLDACIARKNLMKKMKTSSLEMPAKLIAQLEKKEEIVLN